MLVLGIILTLKSIFLTDSLCGLKDKHRCLKDKHRCLFNNDIYQSKKLKKPNKKQTDMVLPVSSKVGLGNNCPMLNVHNVVPLVVTVGNRTYSYHNYYTYCSYMLINCLKCLFRVIVQFVQFCSILYHSSA